MLPAWDLSHNYNPFLLIFFFFVKTATFQLDLELTKQHHVKLKRFINSEKKQDGLVSSQRSLSGGGR